MALIDEIRRRAEKLPGTVTQEEILALIAYHDAAEQYDWDALAAARKKLGDE